MVAFFLRDKYVVAILLPFLYPRVNLCRKKKALNRRKR
jgi:hypothetical protein